MWSNLKKVLSIRNITLLISSFFTILLFFILAVFSPSALEVILLISLFLLFSISILLLLRYERKQEHNEIKQVIKKIRGNEYKSSDEISLSSNLRELEDEIKAMFSRTQSDIQNLKKLEQIRTEFLGNVSHELRTPIFSIQGYIETLLDGALEDPKVNRAFLLKANNHTLNLNNLLNDLIDISMIESGQMKMSFRYFNIHELLKVIENEFKPEVVKKNLVLSIHSPNPKLDLYGDKQRLKQVLSNLITNAIKYTESGSIEAGVIEEGNYGKIYVRDTGLGIPEADLSRIFERFYRIDRDRSREMGGTGLGLAIVKHIIEAHDSKIEVSSRLGIGSEFIFRLKK
ncbi:MAG: two-component sensor histidine kinase [Stygiobacter sp. RIFOXYC12_FULL_38_8]|nr:MAG: two-component sensor histidine kinase [Stygiobacter sp. GWC2_38_9]OGU77296.1 MAG: two-component sensor histidine kinase [Stygiobacter sp. RIFOXYA12_FULL_38_9]OGV09156.1 MAG: two-component sensor histidine kinase [Stygiobacter sp. RIFOXYB2_FULL_37_11]OGV14197.1 MAG: two-component sensor histidine kinase [Stygiobacter sp. RIFOXYA2_FULL_38_8]OGV16388.1 MAG: two-component sensor histidine kinase [Stygiobacter sp. RIFOXYC2_FULL_38_25]OGV25660.1 MAG: two-component sensor histidine kinase [St